MVALGFERVEAYMVVTLRLSPQLIPPEGRGAESCLTCMILSVTERRYDLSFSSLLAREQGPGNTVQDRGCCRSEVCEPESGEPIVEVVDPEEQHPDQASVRPTIERPESRIFASALAR